ncbi:MAG TPA: hypothetical protein VIH35_06110, partial [Kiritimatiellia bacterium]
MATGTHADKVSEILLQRNAIKPDVLREAKADAENSGTRLEKVLLEKNLVTGTDMALTMSEYLNMPPITLSHFTVDPHLLEQFQMETLTKHLIMPLTKTSSMLTVAMGDPFDFVGLETVHSMTGLNVVPLVAPAKEVTDMLAKFIREPTQGLEDILKDVEESEDELEVGTEKKEEV